jgi:hypothetical protein
MQGAGGGVTFLNACLHSPTLSAMAASVTGLCHNGFACILEENR